MEDRGLKTGDRKGRAKERGQFDKAQRQQSRQMFFQSYVGGMKNRTPFCRRHIPLFVLKIITAKPAITILHPAGKTKKEPPGFHHQAASLPPPGISAR